MQNFVEKVLEALTQAGVEFIVVGGVSAVLQGVPVVTQDLDLCYRRTPENVRRLASALRSFHPKLRGLPEGVPNVVDDRCSRPRWRRRGGAKSALTNVSAPVTQLTKT